MYSPILDGDVYHNDDLTVVGEPLSRVNLVAVNYENAASRNLADIRRNIAASKARQAKILLPYVC